MSLDRDFNPYARGRYTWDRQAGAVTNRPGQLALFAVPTAPDRGRRPIRATHIRGQLRLFDGTGTEPEPVTNGHPVVLADGTGAGRLLAVLVRQGLDPAAYRVAAALALELDTQKRPRRRGNADLGLTPQQPVPKGVT